MKEALGVFVHMSVERQAIDLFKGWCKGKIRYSGRSKNANKMAKILPLYQGFVRDTADFWSLHYRYSMRGAKPGPLSPMYPLFRDRILLQALTEVRAEMKHGFDPHNLPPLRYVMKHTPLTSAHTNFTDGHEPQKARGVWLPSPR